VGRSLPAKSDFAMSSGNIVARFIATWTNLADSLSYEPFAAVKAMRFGNGLSAANDWGNDSRLALRCRCSSIRIKWVRL